MPQLDFITLFYIASFMVFVYSLFMAYTLARSYHQLLLRRKFLAKYATLVYQRAKVRQKLIFTITKFPHIPKL